MEYRSAAVRQPLEKLGREASMLHIDVLVLIYHFARFGAGNVLEIGLYIGGSTIAAAFGARDSGTKKKIITIEAGATVKHFRLSSRNIIKDLKKNVARFGVAKDVTLINGRSSDEAIISEVRRRLSSREVSLLFSMRTITCAGIWIATVNCLTPAAGS
jgi:predicted O-methyltransferase YrrM